MDFVSNRQPQIEEMLKTLGIRSIDELFQSIPSSLKLPSPPLDDGISESQGLSMMETLGVKNSFPNFVSYLGAGAYEHYIPAIVQAVTSRQEFFTSYTPYQPEVSQGTLQAIFEFQSAICALTGMDVSNASVYDGASACAEGLLMCLRMHKNRNSVLIAENVHPHYQAVVQQYVSHNVKTVKIHKDGTIDLSSLEKHLDEDTAGVLLQSPNFFGIVEDLKPIIQKIKEKGTSIVLCRNPLAYGILQSAKELGADVAVGDTQPFGLPLHFGGPYCGYIACRQEWVRQLPGRIVGETLDREGKKGFVLTLQAREQHIRREKATSNICTNQSLAALASLITILWYGKEGLKKLALMNYQKAAYLKDKLSKIPGIKVQSRQTTFNEFVVDFGKSPEIIQNHFRKHLVEPGVPLQPYYSFLKGSFLLAVTETKSKEELDHYIYLTHLTQKE